MTENWDGGSCVGNEFTGTKTSAIELDNGVKALPSGAFSNCKSVTNVVFYGEVPTTFSTSTFNGCSNYQMYWLAFSKIGMCLWCNVQLWQLPHNMVDFSD